MQPDQALRRQVVPTRHTQRCPDAELPCCFYDIDLRRTVRYQRCNNDGVRLEFAHKFLDFSIGRNSIFEPLKRTDQKLRRARTKRWHTPHELHWGWQYVSHAATQVRSIRVVRVQVANIVDHRAETTSQFLIAILALGHRADNFNTFI